MSTSSAFVLGQIVKGQRAGTFVVIGTYTSNGEAYVQVKTVNPSNHAQMGRGELALPASAVMAA
jgi:hypothetical protein